MNNKGNLEFGPVQQAETKCDSHILNSEARTSRFRNRILNLILPIFLVATGCAAGNKTVLMQDSPKPPAEAAKKNTGKISVPKKAKDKKSPDVSVGEKKEDLSEEERRNREWEKEINRLQYDSEEYWKCWAENECDQV